MSPKLGRDSVRRFYFPETQVTWPRRWTMGLLRLIAPGFLVLGGCNTWRGLSQFSVGKCCRHYFCGIRFVFSRSESHKIGGRRLTLFPLVSTNPMISNGISIAYAKSVHCQRQQNVYCFVYREPFYPFKSCSTLATPNSSPLLLEGGKVLEVVAMGYAGGHAPTLHVYEVVGGLD